MALFSDLRSPSQPASLATGFVSNTMRTSRTSEPWITALRESSHQELIALEAEDLTQRKYSSIGPKRFQALRHRWEVISTVNLRLAAGENPSVLPPPPPLEEEPEQE